MKIYIISLLVVFFIFGITCRAETEVLTTETVDIFSLNDIVGDESDINATKQFRSYDLGGDYQYQLENQYQSE